MKRLHLKSIILLLMAIFTGVTFFACNDDDEKEERKNIVMEDVTNNSPCIPDNSEVNIVKVINNYEELQEVCSYYAELNTFEIDFSKYSIVLAYGCVEGGTDNDLIKGKLERYKGEYSLIIDIWNDDTQVNMSYWNKWFLVKKIDPTSKISLKVNLHKN